MANAKIKAPTMTADEFYQLIDAAGEKTAAGNDSIVELGQFVFSASRKSLCVMKPVEGKVSVEEAYLRYAAKANDSKYGTRVDVSDKKKYSSSVSKLARFNKLSARKGSYKEVWASVELCAKMVKEEPSLKIESAWNLILKAVKYANDKDINGTMTRAQILDAITPKEDVSDPVLKALKSLVNSAESAAKSESMFANSHRFAAIAASATAQLEDYKKVCAARDNADSESEMEDDEPTAEELLRSLDDDNAGEWKEAAE